MIPSRSYLIGSGHALIFGIFVRYTFPISGCPTVKTNVRVDVCSDALAWYRDSDLIPSDSIPIVFSVNSHLRYRSCSMMHSDAEWNTMLVRPSDCLVIAIMFPTMMRKRPSVKLYFLTL
jgi:hypothetical protein